MATSFWGEGNIGTKPEFKEIANGNNEPYRLLRLNVYFDNPIPKSDGEYEDRGGYWAGVEVWHKDAERYSELYCKGMRVLVIGRMLMDKWEDDKGVFRGEGHQAHHHQRRHHEHHDQAVEQQDFFQGIR